MKKQEYIFTKKIKPGQIFQEQILINKEFINKMLSQNIKIRKLRTRIYYIGM